MHGALRTLLQPTRPDLSLPTGACEVASSLESSQSLQAKLQQVFKEAVAIWYTNGEKCSNAAQKHADVIMLLTDGPLFMMVK